LASTPLDQRPTEVTFLSDLETNPGPRWVEFSSGDFADVAGEDETDRSGRAIAALPPPARPLRIVLGRPVRVDRLEHRAATRHARQKTLGWGWVLAVVVVASAAAALATPRAMEAITRWLGASFPAP
jgi:hypothetical protein